MSRVRSGIVSKKGKPLRSDSDFTIGRELEVCKNLIKVGLERKGESDKEIILHYVS